MAYQSVLEEKPLPTPDLPARWSISVAHTQGNVRTWAQRWFPQWMRSSGSWRQTIMAGTVVCAVVMVLNIAIFSWGSTRSVDPATSQRILAEGECDAMQNISTYWHLAINVFSTLLLATSNSAMQCLSAPTREAADRAHASGMWVDIGISSLRNWRYMDRWRKWCWIVLVASTLPLHLLYNSAIFLTISATEYWAVAVTPAFLNGADFVVPDQSNFLTRSEGTILSQSTLTRLSTLATSHSLLRLENRDCLSHYSQTLQTKFSNVLLVAKNVNSSEDSSVLRYYHHFPFADMNWGAQIYGPNWICGVPDGNDDCDLQYVRDRAAEWNLTALVIDSTDDMTDAYVTSWAPPIDVDYCLAETIQPMCSVQLIPEIMLIVLIANLAKVICFSLTIRVKSFRPLVTLGDGLASFLAHPDPHTKNLGPLSAEQIRRAVGRAKKRRTAVRMRRHTELREPGVSYHAERPDPLHELPLELGPWKDSRRRWFSGASKLRWILTYLLMLGFWTVPAFFLSWLTSYNLGGSFKSQLSTGFGNLSPASLLTGTDTQSVLVNVISANAPQIALSVVYLSLNGLWTEILLSREFTIFAKRRAGLRVTEPRCRYHRSTYWLSLPYRFSLPLMALSWSMHWALSQSLFLAEAKVISADDPNTLAYVVTTLGYSTLAMMILIIMLGATMIVTAALGWIRYFGGAPLVESYSLAISAACHPPPGSTDHSVQLLKYGAAEAAEDFDANITAGDTQRQVSSDWERYAEELSFLGKTDQPIPPLLTTISSFPAQTFTSGAALLIAQAHSYASFRQRSLVATLSSGAVSPLSAPNRYTSIPQPDYEEPDLLRSETKLSRESRRFLSWLIPVFWGLKIVVASVLVAKSTVFGLIDDNNLSILVFALISGVYVLARIMVCLIWLRKKTELHQWWWQVAPEIFFAIVWLCLMPMTSDSMVGPVLCPVTSGLFIASSIIEWWIWWPTRPRVGEGMELDPRVAVSTT